MMIPFEVKMIPLYKLAVDLKLNNTYFGVMIPSLTSTFGIFLMRQFMLSIPNDLIEAGIIDGLSDFRIYWSIILPLVRSATATLTIFTFMWNWDFFIWPLVLLDRAEMFTVPLGLASFLTKDTVRYNLLLTAATVTVIPVIIVFLFGQKHIVKGIALTGIK
jgi:ABC-type glycerol-3-phosphate transport system permease component